MFSTRSAISLILYTDGLAMMQVKAVMIHLLTRFELQLPKDYQLKMVVVPIVKPDDGLPVRLVPRG